MLISATLRHGSEAMAAAPGSQLVHSMHSPPVRLTGRSVDWAVSFGAMGALTAAGATLPFLWMAFPIQDFHLALAGLAAATALMAGATLPGLLDHLRTRVRLRALMLSAVLAGAVWGGLVSGVAASVTAPQLIIPGFSMPLSLGGLIAAGAVVGALQIGWFWLGHAVQTALQRKRWPLVLAAATLAPALGWAAGLLL